MHGFAMFLAVAGFVVGLAASYYWWRASRVATLPTWSDALEPVDPALSNAGWIAGIVNAASQAAKLNQVAAVLTAIAVVLTTGSGLAGLGT